MKKYQKIIIIAIITIAIILFTQSIFASTNLFASVLYSDNMGGFLTEQENSMTKAQETYENAGYTTFKVLEPSETTFLSNLNSANVLLTYSHGNIDSISFDNTGLITGSSRMYNSIYHWSINEIDWTTKKLVVLCACQTAGEGSSDSLSIAARIATAGAQTTIGWYDVISSLSSPDWLDHFHDKLAEGYNPLEAVNYANGQNYMLSGVKSTLVSYNSLSPLNANLEYKTTENNILNNTNTKSILKASDAESQIKSFDKTFDIENYKKTQTNGIYLYDVAKNNISKYTSYIDYNYVIGDYILNSGYTVVLDKNDTVLEIIDNTKDFNYEEVSQKLLTTSTVQEINNTDIINKIYYYDIDKDQKYVEIEYSEKLNKENEIIEIN